jgi:hypothetical protein
MTPIEVGLSLLKNLAFAGLESKPKVWCELRVGSKITQVFPLGVKETRCCGILSEKCSVFKGLLRTDYAKLFLYDP